MDHSAEPTSKNLNPSAHYLERISILTTPNPQDPQVVYVKEPKKPWYKRAGCMIPLTLAILAILAVGGCTALFSKAASDVSADLDREYEVTYVVSGDFSEALATYHSGEANTLQDAGIQPGWEKTVSVKGLFGAYLDVMDTGFNDNATTITCTIKANGKVVAENTATTSASCSASSDQLKEAFGS